MSSIEQEAKQPANDYKYTTSGLVSTGVVYNDSLARYYNNGDTVTKKDKIDILIKALGTMVVFPDYGVDPNNIGKKFYKGNIQMPILQDSQRDKALEKLSKLIEEL